MTIKHNYQSATANDGAKEVSSTRWNEGHDINGVIALLQPSSSFTAGTAIGTSWTVAATKSTPGRSNASAIDALHRAVYTTSTTSGNASGEYSALLAWIGDASGRGGFKFFCRFAVVTFLSDMQILVGLTGIASILAGEPSARNNTVCIGKDSTDTNWQLIFRDTSSATKVDLGLAVAAGQVLEVSFDCPPNGSTITARVERIDSPSVLANDTTHTATLPANTAMLVAEIACRTTQAAACAVANSVMSICPGAI